jgi:hypothetical protein
MFDTSDSGFSQQMADPLRMSHLDGGLYQA